MSYLPNADSFVYYEKLPWAIHGMVSPNNDGTYTIILNSRYPKSQLLKTYWHEQNHIKFGDFNNGLPIEMVEDL